MKNTKTTNIGTDPLTTGEIAKYCHVTVRAVLKWVAEGKLKSYRTPGKHSRVRVADFVAFLNEYNMPIPAELKPKDQRKRILVVDDDKQVVNLIRKLLKIENRYELRAAYDGFSAGQNFCDFQPDLVVLDINLPGLDGFEVCKQIRSNPKGKDVKIIAVSGLMNTETGEKMLALGANDYMTKPFNNVTFKTKVELLLGKGQQEGEEEGADYDRR